MPCVGQSPLDRLLVACRYQSAALRRAVAAFKYDGVRELAWPLAEILARYLEHLQSTAVLRESFDCVMPVPLHRRRWLWRGYNQAELLAQPLAQHLSIPLATNLVVRRRATNPQVGRRRDRRQSNVRGAFAATGQSAPPRVLLLDDVVTTCSTLRACAEALRSAGAQSVTALALAHG